MAKINKVGRAAHQLHNPARDLLYEYADLQRELDLQINEVEELEGMEPDRLRDELIARIQRGSSAASSGSAFSAKRSTPCWPGLKCRSTAKP